MRLPYAVHYECHVAHVRDWPRYAKVWMTWGSFGWRPGIVVGHRENRVGVRVLDGKWPFDGPRANRIAFRSPNMLRARRDENRPKESSSGAPSCVKITGWGAPRPEEPKSEEQQP